MVSEDESKLMLKQAVKWLRPQLEALLDYDYFRGERVKLVKSDTSMPMCYQDAPHNHDRYDIEVSYATEKFKWRLVMRYNEPEWMPDVFPDGEELEWFPDDEEMADLAKVWNPKTDSGSLLKYVLTLMSHIRSRQKKAFRMHERLDFELTQAEAAEGSWSGRADFLLTKDDNGDPKRAIFVVDVDLEPELAKLPLHLIPQKPCETAWNPVHLKINMSISGQGRVMTAPHCATELQELLGGKNNMNLPPFNRDGTISDYVVEVQERLVLLIENVVAAQDKLDEMVRQLANKIDSVQYVKEERLVDFGVMGQAREGEFWFAVHCNMPPPCSFHVKPQVTFMVEPQLDTELQRRKASALIKAKVTVIFDRASKPADMAAKLLRDVKTKVENVARLCT